MADIARIAGVSKSTVSRALSDSPLVNDATKELVRKIAKEHNYRVNVAARNFRLKESLTVALVIPAADGVDWKLSAPFFLQMTAAIAEALDDMGHTLLLTRTKPQSGEWIEEYVAKRQSDGMILVGQGTQHAALQRIAQTYGAISVWGEAIPGALYPTVGSDNVLGGRKAAEHLIERGCKRLAFVGAEASPESEARLAGFRAVIDEHGFSLEDSLVFPPVTGNPHVLEVISRVVEARADYDGIFAATDLQALTIMTAMMQAGIAVPQQCKIIGFDDLPIAEWYNPPLTTMHQDLELGAKALVDNLMTVINGGEAQHVKLNPELVVREST